MIRWIDPQPSTAGALSALGLSPLVEGILLRRGISDVSDAHAFLHPESVAPTPFPGIERMVERLQAALRDEEAICIWGDFDVDGQTATALLVEALRLVGARVGYYVPIRRTEGHGVQISSLKRILDGGVRLVLTCDTGITAHDAISYAKGRGAQFLITDHHDPDETLPGPTRSSIQNCYRRATRWRTWQESAWPTNSRKRCSAQRDWILPRYSTWSHWA
ncbi:MAG: DHH family phosphoesterase [Chloroflexota bacterium]